MLRVLLGAALALGFKKLDDEGHFDKIRKDFNFRPKNPNLERQDIFWMEGGNVRFVTFFMDKKGEIEFFSNGVKDEIIDNSYLHSVKKQLLQKRGLFTLQKFRP